jgi:hypothetical protein
MIWVAWRGDNDIDNIVPITAQDIQAEMKWFEREYAWFLKGLREGCGAPVHICWGVLPQVPQ